jgi:Protein of unknown function (DUF 659)
MINWRLNVAQPAAAVILPADINLRALPGGIDPAIQQPTDEIVHFVWIVAKTQGNNEYQCKLCDTRFRGQPSKVGSHFNAEFSSQRIKLCRHAGNLPDLLKQQLQRAIETKKRKITDLSVAQPSQRIDVILASAARPDADAAILQFLVCEGISPLIVKQESFRNMLRKVGLAGSQYIPPSPQDFGLNRSRSQAEHGLGKVLSDELHRCRNEKTRLLKNISYVGGTICNDGAKWRKRSLINSTLMTSHGPFFAQSTDATGKFKDAHFLLQDIKTAIINVGNENVFIVCLDGACKKTLKLIWDAGDMCQIFPQRCTTHGCNLLVADVGKNFKHEIALCVRLVKFICNHDSIFAIFAEIPGALQLLGVVETRFASQIYSSERILHDKQYIKELFFSAKLREYLARAPAEQRVEHAALEQDFVSNAPAWERVKIFVNIEIPIRTLLRISDGLKPNLAEICFDFETAKRASVAAAVEAEGKYPVEYVGLGDRVERAISKRKKDIVTSLCLAAAMVLPKHVYVPANVVPYEPEGDLKLLMR